MLGTFSVLAGEAQTCRESSPSFSPALTAESNVGKGYRKRAFISLIKGVQRRGAVLDSRKAAQKDTALSSHGTPSCKRPAALKSHNGATVSRLEELKAEPIERRPGGGGGGGPQK